MEYCNTKEIELEKLTNVIIRQPGYLPNLGFFKKIQSSDTFVFLDDVQFEKDSFDNRNRIRTKDGTTWLTVPIKRPVFKKKFNEILISNDIDWHLKHLSIIEEAYHTTPFFTTYWYSLQKILDKNWTKLIDLNIELIRYFMSALNLTTYTINSSTLKIPSNKSQKLLDICKHLDASCYISGKLGKDYLDEEIFHNSGIKIIYENFQHPAYKQIHGNFIENMSILDLLFNEGENSQKILGAAKNF